MQKRIISNATSKPPRLPDEKWLDLTNLADVELTSEDPDHPIESALLPVSDGLEWRAADPGEQTIRIVFNAPQQVRRIWLEFSESRTPRTQEFALRWSEDQGMSFRELVRQQWNFSPHGATSETEDYSVELDDVSALELIITPDTSGGDARASLARLRLA